MGPQVIELAWRVWQEQVEMCPLRATIAHLLVFFVATEWKVLQSYRLTSWRCWDALSSTLKSWSRVQEMLRLGNHMCSPTCVQIHIHAAHRHAQIQARNPLGENPTVQATAQVASQDKQVTKGPNGFAQCRWPNSRNAGGMQNMTACFLS